jgi:Ni/Co efflux regulator RcnB
MLKKIILSVAAVFAASSFCLAQTAPAKENAHRSYDQRARDCKKQGAEQQLSGEELRTFVAKCLKG